MGGATAAAAGAAMVRARRRLTAHFRDAGATTADAATACAPDRGIERRMLARMIAAGVVREAAPGRYWLDEPVLETWNRARRRRAAMMVGAAAAIGAAVAFLASGA